MCIRDRTYSDLLWPLVRALKDLGGSGTNADLLAKVIELEKIAPEVQSLLQNETGNETKLGYNLAWAKTCLKKVGAVNNSKRGVWSLTNVGEKLVPADIAKIKAQVPKIIADEKKKIGGAVGDQEKSGESIAPGADADTPNPDEPDADWKNKLLSVLKSMPPDLFERLSSRMLREAGMTGVRVTGKSGDGGIDGVGIMPVGLISFSVVFQCKRYKGSVGAGEIRDFRGAMDGAADRGIFITTGMFTNDATKEATRPGAKRIELIDGEAFCGKLKELKLGVRTEIIEVENVIVDPSWFDDPGK